MRGKLNENNGFNLINTIAIMLKLKYNLNLLAVKFIRKTTSKNKLIFNVKITKKKRNLILFKFSFRLGSKKQKVINKQSK